MIFFSTESLLQCCSQSASYACRQLARDNREVCEPRCGDPYYVLRIIESASIVTKKTRQI